MSDDIDYSAFGTEVHATFSEWLYTNNNSVILKPWAMTTSWPYFLLMAVVYAPMPDLVLWGFGMTCGVNAKG
ncbi:MAG: hypothetical protein R2764_15705 [Bacteroidales bacterium]